MPTETAKQMREKQALLQYYKHIHRKNSTYTFDDRREKKLRTALRCVGVAKCAQAILGILYIDWYQGMNKDGRVWDDLVVIFKHAYNTEKFIESAEQQGITGEIALSDFQAFIQGVPSPYRKPDIKAAQNKRKREELPQGITAQIEKQYRAFAHSVAGLFFSSGVGAKDVLELCDTNAALKAQGEGLTDANLLFESLLSAGLVGRSSEIPNDVRDAMREFTTTFCELNEVNL